ncbi:hypothetical protein ACLOAU_18235 [Niabella sp. CJ426]|uniref:hypothetical protein n=1 Tax=Niabella sp. CJ426 TaxID=3393740 RepID=UPI003D021956
MNNKKIRLVKLFFVSCCIFDEVFEGNYCNTDGLKVSAIIRYKIKVLQLVKLFGIKKLELRLTASGNPGFSKSGLSTFLKEKIEEI